LKEEREKKAQSKKEKEEQKQPEEYGAEEMDFDEA
jgi:hypothetical protein